MKNWIYLFPWIIAFTLLTDCFGQAPDGFHYQSYIRDNDGNPLDDQSVALRFSVLSGSTEGSPVYVETHSVQTNSNGLVTLVIGRGTPVSGTFLGIDWTTGSKFLKVALDDTGGTDFSEIGITEFFSVPYALYASEAGNVADAIQQLEISGNTLSISSGNAVTLPTQDYGSSPRFPDGISGTTVFLGYGDTYHVPVGKTYYRIDDNFAINVPYVAQENSDITVPTPSGDLNGDGMIDANDTPGPIGSIGVLVEKGVEVVRHTPTEASPYIVPDGKILHILKVVTDYSSTYQQIKIGSLLYEISPTVGLPGGTVVKGCEGADCVMYGYLK